MCCLSSFLLFSLFLMEAVTGKDTLMPFLELYIPQCRINVVYYIFFIPFSSPFPLFQLLSEGARRKISLNCIKF